MSHPQLQRGAIEEVSSRPCDVRLDVSGSWEEGLRLIQEAELHGQEESQPEDTLTWDRVGSLSYPPYEEEQISLEERGRLLKKLDWMEGQPDQLKRPRPEQ